jgi:hypothetical protein
MGGICTFTLDWPWDVLFLILAHANSFLRTLGGPNRSMTFHFFFVPATGYVS